LGIGSNVNVPLLDTEGCAKNSAVFEFVSTKKLMAWAASFAGPGEIAVAQLGTETDPTFIKTVWSGPATNEGGSFTAAIISENVRDAVAPSASVTVIVIEPLPV
jgi:hypothetical protein